MKKDGSEKIEKITALVSSGVQSIALLKHLAGTGRVVQPVFVQCGFRWEGGELFWLKKFLARRRIPRLLPLSVMSFPLREVRENHWAVTGSKVPGAGATETAVPGHTLALLTKGAFFAAQKTAGRFAIGLSKTTAPADMGFLEACAQVFSIGLGARITIEAPFLRKGKEETMFEARDVGFESSFSCVNPSGYRHCGGCFKCAGRRLAFSKTGITDRTPYLRNLPAVRTPKKEPAQARVVQ